MTMGTVEPPGRVETISESACAPPAEEPTTTRWDNRPYSGIPAVPLLSLFLAARPTHPACKTNLKVDYKGS